MSYQFMVDLENLKKKTAALEHRIAILEYQQAHKEITEEQAQVEVEVVGKKRGRPRKDEGIRT